MGRGMNRVKKKVLKVAAVAVIVILLVFAAGCSGDLLGYIKYLIQGGVIDLPRTGQTTCYDVDGNVIDGSGTGQDGDLQMGVAWPGPRFTDNDNGTITDNLTGLMWEQAPSWDQVTWIAALTYADDLDLGGHDDWRLPNVNELESLVNAGVAIPGAWLNETEQGFDSVREWQYYSSTDWEPGEENVWVVNLFDGRVIGYPLTGSFVWAVRGGQAGGAVSLPRTGQTVSDATGDDGDLKMGVAWPVPRFMDNGDGTITDTLTGLMWEQAPSVTQVNWIAALTYAIDLDLGGHRDWRLPNRKELRSLIHYGKADTVAWLEGLDQGFSSGSLKTGSDNYYYWSSTTCAPTVSEAWCVRMYDGTMQPYLKNSNTDRFVLAVRGGE